jgi:hypothetical protein
MITDRDILLYNEPLVEKYNWPDQLIEDNKDLWIRDPKDYVPGTATGLWTGTLTSISSNRQWTINDSPTNYFEQSIEKLKFIFAKYRVSDFLWYPINNKKLARDFITFSQGCDIHIWSVFLYGKSINFPFKARRACHFFKHLDIKALNFEHAIYLAKIICHISTIPKFDQRSFGEREINWWDVNLATEFIKIYNWQPYDNEMKFRFYFDILYWMIGKNIAIVDILPLCKFFESYSLQKIGNLDFSLFFNWKTSKTFREMELFNFGEDNIDYLGLRWKSLFKTVIIDRYEFEDISTSRALLAESIELRHNVNAYLKLIQNQKCKFISVKDKHTSRKLTLQITITPYPTITQIRGYRNRLPNNEEMQVIEKWAFQNNVKIKLMGLGFISDLPNEWMGE